eukprot:gene11302-4113_t
MPKLSLLVKFEVENLEKIYIPEPSSFGWKLIIKCSNCGELCPKFVVVCQSVEEDLKMKSGRGTTNLNYKCKFCKRDSMIDLLPETVKPYICEKEEYQEMVSFDCRGVEILKWEWKGTEGLFTNVEDGEEFEVDLQDV